MKTGAKKGRPKAEIKPIQSIRLKQIMDEQGLNQTQLAKLIPVSQQALSKVMTHSGNISEETAKRIAALFPESGYRYEWIMGYDDIPTREYAGVYERAMRLRDQLENESYNRSVVNNLLAIFEAGRKHGKSDISIESPCTYQRMHDEGLISEEEWDGWIRGGNQTEHMKQLAAEHSDYVVTVNDESVNIPIRLFFLLADNVEQYTVFQLKELIRNMKRGLIQ